MGEAPRGHKDVGLTHVALQARDPERSVRFYARYARMQVVHRRRDASGREVLIQAERVEGRLEGFAHLGVGCESRAEVDRLCEQARREGCLRLGPLDHGPPVGYWAFLADPDGHNLEISYGQEVALTVEGTSG
jgi:catechol 2,3-dioxygenase-like lactoylglutathione lyase family enzyme